MRLPIIEVAATIVRAPDGRVLLAERTRRQIAAGFWELPGGKIEPGETALAAAARELEEEIGIRPIGARKWISYHHDFRTRRLRLRFFLVERWAGEPTGREGQRLRWVDPAAPSVTPILPSNDRVLLALGLPSLYAMASADPTRTVAVALETVARQVADGARLIQVGAPDMPPDQRVALARRAQTFASGHGARVLLSGSALEAGRAGVAGVHSSSIQLGRTSFRPPVQLWIASCHDAHDLARATALGADAAVVSPVLPCARHPERQALGWDGLRNLAATASIPLFAHGGLSAQSVAQARGAGAVGVALRADSPATQDSSGDASRSGDRRTHVAQKMATCRQEFHSQRSQ